MNINNTVWTFCPECRGQGKKSRGLSKKARLQYQAALNQFEKSENEGVAPVRPKAHLYTCTACSGLGIINAESFPLPDVTNYPQVAIIGGGIGGVALAVACLHRGIPFTLYERDDNFSSRAQGYGLTLQQAGKAIEALGITILKDKLISTKHVVHTIDGNVIGEWGLRKWLSPDAAMPSKRSNMHISRQSLRMALLEQLGGHNVKWGHQLIYFKKSEVSDEIILHFEANGVTSTAKADLIVGADGIRSTVRRLLIGENNTPLRYLDCIVILGICPLSALDEHSSPLLDAATVFQTANGNERIYMMPYTSDSVMWQLSFPMPEDEAKALSAQGAVALKAEACRRTQWHDPIPQILAATPAAQVSGYPVYDRELLTPQLFKNAGAATLLGDAAHPMSPFKGQGANQALLDALTLAREITRGCRSGEWRKTGIKESALNAFEAEMLERSAVKVKDSAAAAQFLHSEVVLREGDTPRGSCVKKNSL